MSDDALVAPIFRKAREAFAVGVEWSQLRAPRLVRPRAAPPRLAFRQQNLSAQRAAENGPEKLPMSVRTGYSPQVNHMPSNPWNLSSNLSPTDDHADPPTGYPTRIMREQNEEAERAQRERIEQSSELNTPAMRIRAWERLHRLTLPRGSAHAVLDVVAKATHLTLEQVREEQRRRAEPARPSQPIDSPGNHDGNSGS